MTGRPITKIISRNRESVCAVISMIMMLNVTFSPKPTAPNTLFFSPSSYSAQNVPKTEN